MQFRILLFLFLFSAAGLVRAQNSPAFPDVEKGNWQTLENGIKILTLKPGNGADIADGQKVYARYSGWLLNGTPFDSNAESGNPYKFIQGKHKVIPGWEEAVKVMSPGQQAYLVIPSKLGYGDAGLDGIIPGGCILVFYLEIVEVK